MKRREFFGRLGIGSGGVLAGSVLASRMTTATAGGHQHDHEQVGGPLAQATVSFGQWMTPQDRFPNVNNRLLNQHKLIPYVATIKAGGSVNFIIAGFHQVLVYAPGTQLSDVNGTLLGSTTGTPPPGGAFPPLVNDPTNRVYRGLDPSLWPQERVESVTLGEGGTYLVVCGVLPHFQEGMHGFVKVV